MKPVHEIYQFFSKEYGKEYVHFQDKNLPTNKIPWIKYYYIFPRKIINNNILNLFCIKTNRLSIKIQNKLHINRIKKQERFATGANWFSITNKLCEYVIKNKKYILKRYKYTRSSDEIFLQSLIIKSEFKNNLYYKSYDDNYDGCMRLIDWKRGNPYVFKLEDIKLLKESKYLFARKFNEENIDIVNEIYKYLDKKNNEWRRNGKV